MAIAMASCTLFSKEKTNPTLSTIPEKRQMYKSGEYLFATNGDVPLEELRSLFDEFGIISLELLIIRDRSYKVVLEKDPGLPILEAKTKQFGKIRYIERNQIMQKYKSKP
ncbi:hypothetical protein [Leptospira yanagawae]|nr:hypothetical protein [Leptospira yanagawae]